MKDAPAAPSPARLALLGAAVAVAAVAVRLWTLRDLEAADPLFHVTILDEAVYVREATRFHEGLAPTSPSLVALLWPGTMALFGAVSRHAASILNVGIGTLVAALAAVGAARLAGSIRAGLVAGTICALSGALVFTDVTAQIEPLLSLAVLASALSLAAAARKPTWTRLAVAGLASGVAILGRGSNVALLVGALPALRGVGLRMAVLRALAVVLCVATPIVAFDRAVGAVPTSAGVNLWLGNNAWSRATTSFGTDEIAMDPDGEARDIVRVAEAAESRPLSTAQVNGWWARRALREMSAAPGEASIHFAKKAALVFYASDMGGNHDVDAERGYSAWLAAAPVSTAWMLVLGAAGWVAARRLAPGADAVALAAAGGLVALIAIFPLTRYVLPYAATASVLAGVGAAAFVRRGADRRARLVAAATIVALAGVSILAGALRPRSRPESWSNLGFAAIESGVGDADALLRRAVEEDPTFPLPSIALGRRALDRGDAKDAAARFDAALAAARDRPRWSDAARDAAAGRDAAERALAATRRR